MFTFSDGLLVNLLDLRVKVEAVKIICKLMAKIELRVGTAILEAVEHVKDGLFTVTLLDVEPSSLTLMQATGSH